MNVLIFIPHDTLIGPQGVLQRLRGLERALDQHNIVYLIPDTVDDAGREALAQFKVYFFTEPGILGKKIPYLLDYYKKWLSEMQTAIGKESIDLLIFDFPWGLASAKKKFSLPTAYFSQGVERDFTEITLRHLGISNRLFSRAFRWFISRLEGQACMRADSIVSMSSVDSKRLQALYQVPNEKFFDFPQPILNRSDATRNRRDEPNISPLKNTEVWRRKLALSDESILLIFHGSWQHLPNREAVGLLRSVIVPKVREKFPECYFLIAGSGVPEFSENGIRSIGFVSDLPELFAECDIAVVPILSGSGVRMKIFDYFQSGLPCVSTRKGIEGLSLRDGTEMLVSEDDADSLIRKLFLLISDKELRALIRKHSVAYLEREHDPAKVCVALCSHLESLCLGKNSTSLVATKKRNFSLG